MTESEKPDTSKDTEESKSSKSNKWPSKEEVDKHVQRDSYTWDDETGWNPPADK